MSATKRGKQVEFDRILGKAILEHREKIGMSRADLAVEIGRTKALIQAIESGKMSSNIYRIVEICLIMEVNPGDILDRAVYELHTQKSEQ